MSKKELYAAPETEVLELVSETIICTSIEQLNEEEITW